MSLQKNEYNKGWPNVKSNTCKPQYNKSTPGSSTSQGSHSSTNERCRKPDLNYSMHQHAITRQECNLQEQYYDNSVQPNVSFISNSKKNSDSLNQSSNTKATLKGNYDSNLYWNSNELQQTESKSDKQVFTDNLHNHTHSSNISHKLDTVSLEVFSTREEIVAQRRLKVAARRQMKKLEKQQLKEIVSEVQVEKPNFSLEQAAEDFPALNAVKKTKKNKCNNINTKNNTETNLNEVINNKLKISDKSWKPKIKDPICFNISQVLQAKPEKSKAIVKKAEPPSQRTVVVGNILDADCPQLKKGKVRPNKVKKPTNLKEQILLDRIERRKKASSETEDQLNPIEEQDPVQPGYPLCNVEENILCSSDTGCDYQPNQLLTKHAVFETEIRISPTNEIPITQDCNFPNNIHSRKFRDYCTNCLTEDLTTSLCTLLERVAYFQDRLFAKDPIKANAKRRYVAGLNQARKYLFVKKVKLLVIAPDLEKSSGKGGLDEKVHLFKKEAEFQGVPCAFGPNRKRLGRAVSKNTLVSCVAVLSYDGAEEEFSKVMEALHKAKSTYEALTSCPQDNDVENIEHIFPQSDKEVGIPNSDITYSLFATLKEEILVPADKLLSAIEHGGH